MVDFSAKDREVVDSSLDSASLIPIRRMSLKFSQWLRRAYEHGKPFVRVRLSREASRECSMV